MVLFGFLRRRFVAGFACGVAAVLLARLAINEGEWPDRLVAPLLLEDSTASADAIVVLGGGSIGDCVPNLNSLRRVVRAARLLREQRAPVLVVTGGTLDDSCAVADAMGQFAHELGVPDEKMIIERRSRNTRENAEFSTPLLLARNVRRILLVTDRLHMRRAAGEFAQRGFIVEPSAVPVYEGHPDNVSMLVAGVRESAALAYYGVRGWMDTRTNAQEGGAARGGAARSADRPQVGSDVPRANRPLVILGASYAGNWPLEAVGPVPAMNAGVAGQRTFEFVERFDRDVVAARPRAVLLWGFINDLFATADQDEASRKIRDNYTQMIARARAAGIEPILATEITVRPRDGWLDWARAQIGRLTGSISNQERINQGVMALNAWLRDTARREGILLLEFQAALADQSGVRRQEYAAEDGSHVTPAGYEALTQYARPILERHFAAAGSGQP